MIQSKAFIRDNLANSQLELVLYENELFITELKSKFKWGFTMLFITRAGRSQEWSKGELCLYFDYPCVGLTLD